MLWNPLPCTVTASRSVLWLMIELNWIGLKNICWLPWLVTPHIILTDRANKCFLPFALAFALDSVLDWRPWNACMLWLYLPYSNCRWIQPIPQHASSLLSIAEPHSSELMCFKYDFRGYAVAMSLKDKVERNRSTRCGEE